MSKISSGGTVLTRLNQILALVVSLLMVLLLLEAGLRILGFAPRSTMNQFDPQLGWVKAPDESIRRHTSEFDVTLSTNSRGLRDDESVGYEKPADTVRILLVGDSFTLGYTVDRAETLSQLLQQRLRSEGRRVEVINAGTEGYSTDQEVLWLNREGKRYAPDIVILQMYENDIFWNGQDSYLRYPKPRLAADASGADLLAPRPPLHDPGRGSWLERNSALATLLLGALSPPPVPMLAPGSPVPAEWGPRLSDSASGWPETRAALRALRQVTDGKTKAVVLVIPDKAQIDPAAREAIAGMLNDPAYDPSRPFRGMVDAARAAGLPVVNPEPQLERAGAAGDRLYFERDWHTNAEGNRVLTEVVAEALTAPDLLGPPPRHVAAYEPHAAPRETGNAPRIAAILAAVWLALGTLYWRRFPNEGAIRAYAQVGGLVLGVVALVVAMTWLVGLLPHWLARWASLVIVVAILSSVLWYLRRRLSVMAELFGTFVRRGQWYALPVLAGLLTIGGLLVVAASSPWLAPFIYTLF